MKRVLTVDINIQQPQPRAGTGELVLFNIYGFVEIFGHNYIYDLRFFIYYFHAPKLDELLLDELLDDILLDDDSDDDDSELDEDELLDDILLEELDPAAPNISIWAKYLSMHFGSNPNLIGPASLIFQTAAVRLLVQLNVTAPIQMLSSKASSSTLSAAEI